MKLQETYTLVFASKHLKTKLPVVLYHIQWRSTSKGDHWIKQWPISIASLFIMRTCLKGKNLLPKGAKSVFKEQFLMTCKITFTT